MKSLPKALIFLCNKYYALYEIIKNIIFPPCCLICGKFNKTFLCTECKKELYEKAIFEIEEKAPNYYFKKHIYIFKYEGKIRNLILDYKFKDKVYLYKIFSEIVTKNKKICGILKKYDIIIPVPIHAKRKKQRGYNQSELIAKEIAKIEQKLQYENSILQKIKHTVPQSSLSKEQRKQNVQNVYKLVNQVKIRNKKIILFDDIYTTGSTATACAKLLKENGAKEIIVLTIAKD